MQWLRVLAIIVTAALALAPLPAAGQASPVVVQLEPRVPADAGADFTRAADLTQQFFRETYSIDLNRSIRIILVPDVAAYAATMIREWNITQTEADRRARTTSGWTNRMTIIVNVDSTRTARSRIFLAAHELTHQFQIQVSAPVGAWGLYWLTEGVADVLGARVIDLARAGTLTDTRQSWIDTLRRAALRPDLTQIDTEQAWFTALDTYGSAVTYRSAAMATLYAAETKGYAPLIAYYQALRDTRDRAQAFQRAIGVTLEEFTTDYKAHLDRVLQ